jgi:hypothetical protein
VIYFKVESFDELLDGGIDSKTNFDKKFKKYPLFCTDFIKANLHQVKNDKIGTFLA